MSGLARRVAAASLWLVSGCVLSAGPGDTVPADPDAAAPDATVARFGEPRLIDALSAPGYDDDPTVTADLRELYFNSDRPGGPGGPDLYVSTRSSPSQPWGAPTLVAELSGPDSETTPEISGDGLTIWFASTRLGGQGDHDIWVATRQSRDEPWDPPVVVPELSSPMGDFGANPDRSLTRIVLHRFFGQDLIDLFEATRDSPDDVWSTPQLIDDLTTEVADQDGMLIADGDEIYFDRGPIEARDLFVARRDPGGGWLPPTPVDDINTPGEDIDPWVSEDGTYMVFVRHEPDGSAELYETSR